MNLAISKLNKHPKELTFFIVFVVCFLDLSLFSFYPLLFSSLLPSCPLKKSMVHTFFDIHPHHVIVLSLVFSWASRLSFFSFLFFSFLFFSFLFFSFLFFSFLFFPLFSLLSPFLPGKWKEWLGGKGVDV